MAPFHGVAVVLPPRVSIVLGPLSDLAAGELAREVVGVPGPPSPVFRETAEDHALEVGGHRTPEALRRWLGLGVQVMPAASALARPSRNDNRATRCW